MVKMGFWVFWSFGWKIRVLLWFFIVGNGEWFFVFYNVWVWDALEDVGWGVCVFRARSVDFSVSVKINLIGTIYCGFLGCVV